MKKVVAKPVEFGKNGRPPTREPMPPLYELIEAEALEAKRHCRKAGHTRVRPGPGRPDINIDWTRPFTSPLPLIDPTALASASVSDETSSVNKSHANIWASAPNLSPTSSHPLATKESPPPQDLTRQDAEKQAIDRCRDEVRQLRDEYNRVRHRLEQLTAEHAAITDRMNTLILEDDVMEERKRATDAMERKQAELGALQDQLESILQYRSTVEFMLKRISNEQLTFNTTLEAYEKLVDVRRQELAQTRALMEKVRQERDAETAALHQLQERAARQKQELQKQLELKRAAAAAKEDLRLFYEKKAKTEAAIKSRLDGDLNSKEEEALKARRTSLSARMSAVGLSAVSAQEELVSWEERLQSLRLAVGAADGCDAQFIIDKFLGRDAELEVLDKQLANLHKRINELRDAQKGIQRDLGHAAQAFDSEAEPEFTRDTMDALDARGKLARRALATAREEHDRVRALHLQIEQSAVAMMDKLSHLEISPPRRPKDAAVDPLVWNMTVIGHKLVQLMSELQPDNSDGDTTARRTAAGNTSPPPSRGSRRSPRRRSSLHSSASVGDIPVIHQDEQQLLSAMADVVAANEFNIRVRPTSATLSRRPSAAVTAKQISAAAMTFSSVQARLLSQQQGGAGVGAGKNGRTPKAKTGQRKGSNMTETTAGEADFDDLTLLRPEDDFTNDLNRRRLNNLNISNDEDSDDGEQSAAAIRRRKQSRLVQYTAAAAAASGGEVDDMNLLAGFGDKDVIPTRVMVKHKANQALAKVKRQSSPVRRRKRHDADHEAGDADDD